MPRGFAAAKKVGDNSNKSFGFQPRPKGITYFSLKDGQSAVVRFVQMAEEIDWARKWRLPPSKGFPYGEYVNAIDQNEDGTPDPGYAANLKSGFRAYPVLIWRNAPVYAKDAKGQFIKDTNGAKQITGYADQIALWECSFAVYQALCQKDEKYRGLTSRDIEITRQGGGTDTKYVIEPADLDAGPQPITDADKALISKDMIDTAPFVKIPTFDELAAYINGGVAPAQPQTFQQQAASNEQAGDAGNPFLG